MKSLLITILICLLPLTIFAEEAYYSSEPEQREYPVRWTEDVNINSLEEIDSLLDKPVDLSQAGKNCELVLINDSEEEKKISS